MGSPGEILPVAKASAGANVLADSKFKSSDSDVRFEMVLAALPQGHTMATVN